MRGKLTKRFVDAIQAGQRDELYWDTELAGLGLKVTPKGRMNYIFQFRMGGRGAPSRRYTIGEHGVFTPDEARKLAEQLKGEVRRGVDPAWSKRRARQERQSALTVAQLCEAYLRTPSQKKASTLATDKGRIARHIVPLLGTKLARELSRSDVQRFMEAIAQGKSKADTKTRSRGRAIVKGGKGTATRTVGLLGGIMSFAVAEGVRDDNPVRGVKRYPDRKIVRYLNLEELGALGAVLAATERVNGEYAERLVEWEQSGRKGPAPAQPNTAENPVALAVIRLLALTGCRKSEALTLRWDAVDLDLGWLNLSDSKTGPKQVPLPDDAIALLAAQRPVAGNPYVFPGAALGKHLVGLPRVWERIRARAGLDKLRLHDLRHSYASAGASAGSSLLIIGKVLGHRDPKSTHRYAHLADDPVRRTANEIGRYIATSMGEKLAAGESGHE